MSVVVEQRNQFTFLQSPEIMACCAVGNPESVCDLLKGTPGMFGEEGAYLFWSAVLLPVRPTVLTAVEDEEGEAESGDEEGDEVCGEGRDVRGRGDNQLPENFFWRQFPQFDGFNFRAVIDGDNVFINHFKCILIVFQWFGRSIRIMINTTNFSSFHKKEYNCCAE